MSPTVAQALARAAQDAREACRVLDALPACQASPQAKERYVVFAYTSALRSMTEALECLAGEGTDHATDRLAPQFGDRELGEPEEQALLPFGD